MTGMTMMSGAVKPLADLPQFKEVLTILDNPIIAILVGAGITALIQSSAASLGILQSLAMTGSISFSMALPVIMGQNIGTCITALLSSIGTTKSAKRVTAVHIYFNVLGTVICLSGFYIANSIFHFTFTDQPISSFMIAVAHSAFNLITTFILLPFCNQLEKLAVITVRDKRLKPGKQDPHAVLLDERLLLSPSFAIAECRNATTKMADLVRDTILDAIGLLSHFDSATAEKIEKNEETIDQYEDKLGSYLVKISSKNLSTSDSNDVSQLLHTIGDFERIGDHAVNLLRVAREIHDKDLKFSEKAQQELEVFTGAIIEILNITTDAFVENNLQLSYEVEPLEQVIDSLKVELKNRHIRRLQEGKCTIELGFVLSDILNNFERVSDHCSNIAVCLIQIKDSTMDTHGYLNEIKTSGDPRFTGYYNRFTSKYTLPESRHKKAPQEVPVKS